MAERLLFLCALPRQVGFDTKALLLELEAAVRELQKAVDSIPYYIEKSAHFFILVPPVVHFDIDDLSVDFSSWSSRGWCRLELFAQIMAAHTTPMIRLMASGSLVEAFGFEWIYKGPRTGNFSVEEDRMKVEAIMSAAYGAKLESLSLQSEVGAAPPQPHAAGRPSQLRPRPVRRGGGT